MASKKMTDSPTKLTEFAPLSSDSRPSGSFFSRLFKRSNEPTEEQNAVSSQSQFFTEPTFDKTTSEENSQISPGQESSKASEEDDDFASEKSESDISSYIPSTMSQTRTLSSVLKRLSNILDRRSTTPQAYKDSDFKQYWMPDDNCKECYECGDKFNTFRRRHHCRICGQIFCSRCCNQEVPGKIMGYTGYLRVCTYCCKVVLSYAQNYAQNPETSGDLRALSEELKHLANIDSEGQVVSGTDLWTPTSRRKHIFDDGTLKRSSSPDITSPGSGRNPFDLTPQSEYSSFDSFQHERRLLTQDSAQLRELWLLMLHPEDGIETQSHRHRLRTYINCFVGSEVVDWLLARDKVANREQAVAIGQAMVDAKWLESVLPNEIVFRDEYALYKPGGSAPNMEDGLANSSTLNDVSIMEDEEAEPAWFREIKASSTDGTHPASGTAHNDSPSDVQRSNSIFYVETTESLEGQKRAKRVKPVPSIGAGSQDASPLPHQDSSIFGIQGITDELFKKDEFVMSSDSVESQLNEGTDIWQQSLDHLREDNGERQAFEVLRKTHKEHLTALTNQLLSKAGLSLKWAESIIHAVHKISLVVRPDVRHEGDDMDLRQYVQIKKLPGGSRSNTGIICGVVCSKNVTHKKMRQSIPNPKILLLRAPLVYQRVENKMSSLEPQILQEYEFLRHCVGRIAALKPDVLLVEKAVSRVAQEFILEAGITLVINVKPSVMQRVSRFTQADIVTSIDGLVNKTTLGFCHSFKMVSFNLAEGRQKSLMYFDGCASHLGCTVILRGGPTAELAKVKKILHFLTYVAYHSKLEISFLMDEFAMPPVDNEENLLDLGVQSPMSESGTFAEGVSQVVKKEKVDEVVGEKGGSEKEIEGSQKEIGGQTDIGASQKEIEPEKEKNGEDKITDGNKTAESRSGEIRKEENMEVSDNGVHENGANDVKRSSNVSKEVDANTNGKADKTKAQQQIEKTTKRSSSKEGKGTTIEDFSDPLQSYQKNRDESIFSGGETKQSLKEEKRANVFKFKATLQDLVLSCSPYIGLDVPYLETEAGSVCNLRKYFPPPIYWSDYLEDQNKPRERSSSTTLPPTSPLPEIRYNEEEDLKKQPEKELFNCLNLLPAHKFVNSKITTPFTEGKNQALLADFRATGGRIWLSESKESKNEDSKRVETSQKGNETPSNGIDCLDPYNHQRIAVLFSSFSYDSGNSPNPCVVPWVVSMDFYGQNDIPLGGFLERYCFRENYMCPSVSCDVPMVDHIRRFVHEGGCITIISKKLDAPLRGHPNNTIYMWQWCRRCKEVSGVTAASVDTWSMSFAKYLELRFHGNMYTRRGCQGNCIHSLHHDHFQYFGYNQIVASFKYSSIQLKKVTLPPIIIEIDELVLPLTNLVDSAKMLSFKGTGVYSTIMEHLHRLKRDSQMGAQVSQLSDYITEVQNNKEMFRAKIDELQTWLASIAAQRCEQHEKDLEQILVEVPELYALSDGLAMVKRIIAEAVYLWNGRILECDQQLRKHEKMKSQTQKEQTQKEINQRQSKDLTDNAMVVDPPPSTPVNVVTKDSDDLDSSTKVINEVITPPEGEDVDKNSETSDLEIDKESSAELENSLGGASVDGASTAPSGGNANNVLMRNASDVSFAGNSGQEVSAGLLKSHDSSDLSGQIQGYSSPDIQRLRTSGDGRKFSKQVTLVHEHSPTDVEKAGEKNLNRASMKNIFSSLLSSADTNPVTMPFLAEEHHLLPPGDRIHVVVHDGEPSSIIAYTLSSAEYELQLQELKNMLQSSRESQNSSPMVKRVKKSDGGPSSDSLEVDPDDFSYFGPGDPLDTGTSKSSKSKIQPTTNYHIELQFSDNTTKFYCRVYFAEQFHRLRKLIFPEGEDRYIRALSNCFNWLARGGKSGSTFCKTQDDRFILKQMSRLEVQSFVEFAPGYFQYVTTAFNEQKATVLAKILGVYRIGYRNSLTGRELKQDLLVMENLFYKRKITQIFDLKGSMRNRLVNTSGKRVEDLVLLDENLLKSSLDNPMYIRPHSKTVLTAAINEDTSFLSRHLIMDYSLLVGLDEINKELVVGIIDYIRTFTWDKKLEMVVKSTYSQLGGQGKMPTVVSPELYRSRFQEAMDRYFLLVPDRWAGLERRKADEDRKDD